MARLGRGIAGRMNKAAGVGQEKKADMRGAGLGGAGALGMACRELREQHPVKYDDMGPHHGGMEHVRHEPLAGLRPKAGQ